MTAAADADDADDDAMIFPPTEIMERAVAQQAVDNIVLYPPKWYW